MPSADPGSGGVAVLLVNLGTPDAPTPAAVKRYLREFLSDPRVVEIPAVVWQPILRGIILNLRPRKSAHAYRQVWTDEGSPLAAITARQRPTSLARFAPGQSFVGARRTGGVNVRVNRGGGAKRIKGAFFVRLRRGGDTGDGFNLGLAIRLKPGEKLRGRRKGGTGVMLAPDLYILQGPSVDQVFREVSVAGSPRIADNLVKEFTRQWVRLSGEK